MSFWSRLQLRQGNTEQGSGVTARLRRLPRRVVTTPIVSKINHLDNQDILRNANFMPSSIIHSSIIAGTGILCAIVGGGIYEHLVIDPVWPRRPDLIQPNRGGISRGRFWMPAHAILGIVLICSLILSWKLPTVRIWLLMALAVHVALRIWSALDFIPKALAFEKASVVDETAAQRWTRRSQFRLPIELLTLTFLLKAAQASFHGR